MDGSLAHGNKGRPKIQITSFKFQTNSKSQAPITAGLRRAARHLEFGHWNMFEICHLNFGILLLSALLRLRLFLWHFDEERLIADAAA